MLTVAVWPWLITMTIQNSDKFINIVTFMNSALERYTFMNSVLEPYTFMKSKCCLYLCKVFQNSVPKRKTFMNSVSERKAFKTSCHWPNILRMRPNASNHSAIPSTLLALTYRAVNMQLYRASHWMYYMVSPRQLLPRSTKGWWGAGF